MMKLRIATGLGLLLFMATMIGGPVRVSQAQDDGGVTLASLAGKYAGSGGGFFTLCLDSSFALVDCASSPAHVLPINNRQISYGTRDTAGNSCVVVTSTTAPVFGTTSTSVGRKAISISTTTTFDPTTGSGTTSGIGYVGGSCNGAVFDMTGATKMATFTGSFIVSDSGNRIESITTNFSAVTSAVSLEGSVKGFVFTSVAIRQ